MTDSLKDINILLVSSKYMPEYSGSGHRAQNLYARMRAKYPEIKTVTLCGSETYNRSACYDCGGEIINRVAGKIFTGASPLKNSVNFFSELIKTKMFLNSLDAKFDLVHIFGKNNVTASALDYAADKKIPALIELCNTMGEPWQYIPGPWSLITGRRFREPYHLVCISEKLGNIAEANGVPREKIWVRPNPVDGKKFHPVPEEKKFELRRKNSVFTEKDTLICYAAKFRPSKNHALLLETMKVLPPEYKLFMKGPLVESGPLAQRDKDLFLSLKIKAASDELKGRVQIESGFSGNVEELYQMADVYAFPSLEEGLGTPMLENAACAVPVAANIIKGVTDTVIRDGENGFLSPPEPEAFAEAVRKAAAIPRETLLASAQKTAETAGVEKTDAEYRELIKQMTGK